MEEKQELSQSGNRKNRNYLINNHLKDRHKLVCI